MEFKQPLSIYFAFHPKDYEKSDDNKIKECLEYCYKSLQRDENKPFSRFINIPVFYNTSLNAETLPNRIETQSEKTIVFLLISKYIVADSNWRNYFKEIRNNNSLCVIPVALDDTAMNIKEFEDLNFIRAFQFEPMYFKENFLLNVAHEIYRWILNKDSSENCCTGQERAIKVFLSHTKEEALGKKIALKIKQFIDDTRLRRFFDATDIAISYKFEEELNEHLNNSTLLAINSDLYSSRYWCQKEILYAKKMNRPIVALDCLNKYEDRRFPHASNVAALHIEINDTANLTEAILYQIILSVLLETLRFYYSELLLTSYKNVGFIPEDSIILSRPPEFCDVEKIVHCIDNRYECEGKKFFYPEPIIYSSELEFFTKLGIESHTPIESYAEEFKNIRIGLSISELNDAERTEKGYFESQLKYLSQDLARYLLASKATLIYGGDLRKGGFTDYIFNEAQILQSRTREEVPPIKNYIAYPIYLNDGEELITWKARYLKIAEMNELPYPQDVEDLIDNPKEFFDPDTTIHKYIWSRSLTYMRETMIENCDVRICAGGKHTNYKGLMPGVLEEILIAKEKEKPLFLLGGFGGVTADVCKIIETTEIPKKLTIEWQTEQDKVYEDLLKYFYEHEQNVEEYYNSISSLNWEILKNNGLNRDENLRLFRTPFIDEAICLIMKGLKNINFKK